MKTKGLVKIFVIGLIAAFAFDKFVKPRLGSATTR